VRLERLGVDAELVAKIARIRKYKPIPIVSDATSRSPAADGWKRADIDPWGRHLGGNAQWVGGRDGCLRSVIAYVLDAADINTVPDSSDLVGNPEWFARYNERLGRIGARLAEVSVDRAFAARRPWIAIVDDDDGQLHAVVSRGNLVQFDPAGNIVGVLPRGRVEYGLTIARA